MDFTRNTINLRRVVITGIGTISPVGKTVRESWENIKNGNSGISTITRFDASEYSTRIAGEVKGFDPMEHFDRKEARKYDPYIQYALVAADEAVRDSGLDLDNVNKERAGVFIGSGIGGISTIELNKKVLMEKGPRRVSPFFLPASLANLASGQVSIKYRFKGPNFATVTACAASTHSVGDTFKIIQRGDADVMISGGAEYPITELGISGFSVMRALSSRNDEPEKASRPFDKERDGFVASEGSSILVLEDLEHAVKRGAKIYAEIIGYGYSSDAFHMTAPDPEAGGMIRAMAMAVKDGGIPKEQVGYINAHGTSTPLNDKLESLAIRQVFGDHAYDLNVSSTKSMTGHMLGATGAAEAIYTILALSRGIIPPTINYTTPDEECDLNYTPNTAVEKDITYAISNSFGFGGTNGSLLIKKFDEQP
jgi:3-oxoacyl-[acyl-carrier-protein] synthase II